MYVVLHHIIIPHIGNARPFVTWDVIRRYMKHVGYKVTYVQNFTDVDDKIINTSNGEGVSLGYHCKSLYR